MEQILQSVPDWLEMAALVLMAVVVLATVVARITPTEADDEAVGAVAKWVIKIVQFLPTIGVNPKTKKLQEALDEIKAQQK